MISTLLAATGDVDFALPANIAFGITAAMMIYCAVRLVTTENVVHAALYLVLVLSGVAGIFILLQAEFVAVTQVLVYLGAIVVLFLFGIMLTRAPLGRSGDLTNRKAVPYAILTAIVLFAVMGYSVISTFEDSKVSFDGPNSTAVISDSIFSDYLIPFEVVSVLLLAALVGAIVLARRD